MSSVKSSRSVDAAMADLELSATLANLTPSQVAADVLQKLCQAGFHCELSHSESASAGVPTPLTSIRH